MIEYLFQHLRCCMVKEYREMTDRLAEHQKRLEDLNDTLEREEHNENYPASIPPHHVRTRSSNQVFFPPTTGSYGTVSTGKKCILCFFFLVV